VGLGAILLVAACSPGQASSRSAPVAPPTSSMSDGPTTAPSGTPSPSTALEAGPKPTLGPEPRWSRLADDRVFVNSSARAMAASPAGYVVVGTSRVGNGEAPAGTAWTSADGRTWRRASGPWTGGQPDGVIHDAL